MLVIFLVFSQMTSIFGYKMPTTGRLLVTKNENFLFNMQVDDFQPVGQRDLAMKKFQLQLQLLQVALVTSVILPQTSVTWASGIIHFR